MKLLKYIKYIRLYYFEVKSFVTSVNGDCFGKVIVNEYNIQNKFVYTGDLYWKEEY